MLYSLKVTSLAYNDIDRIVAFFDKETSNTLLGNRFINEIDICLNNLRVNYNKYQLRYKNVRLIHLKKFKYSIHYINDDKRKRVIIIAIFSSKENPKKWKERHKTV